MGQTNFLFSVKFLFKDEFKEQNICFRQSTFGVNSVAEIALLFASFGHLAKDMYATFKRGENIEKLEPDKVYFILADYSLKANENSFDYIPEVLTIKRQIIYEPEPQDKNIRPI